MIIVKIKRAIKAGFMNFWRNSWVSLAAVLIMVITLSAICSLIFARVVLGNMVSQIQNRVDISVYSKASAGENEVLALKKSVEVLPEVKQAEYVSKEKALEDFKKRNENNSLILQALEELGENPFGAVLNIKTKEISQYESVAKFLEGESSAVKGTDSIIDKINYNQNKRIIDTLSRVLDSTKKLGAVVSAVLIIISILVIFNTIGLVIYASREEIEIMKLVGASNRFVSGPFVIEGAIYGVVSSVITMVLFYPTTLWLGPITEGFFNGVDVYKYYISNFWEIFALLFIIGILLGAISSFIATRRYLKI